MQHLLKFLSLSLFPNSLALFSTLPSPLPGNRSNKQRSGVPGMCACTCVCACVCVCVGPGGSGSEGGRLEKAAKK